VFGMMEAMLSFLRRQVGLRTDAADQAGSLHAKVSNIENKMHAKVSNIENKIGTSSDTRSSNTVMGFLATFVKSVQTGTTEMSGTGQSSATVTISPVNTAKSIVIAKEEVSSANSYSDIVRSLASVTLTSSTRLEISRALGGTSSSGTSSRTRVVWQVIEFY